MASKYIKGITIEIAGDTQKLTKALEGVNKQSRDLQGELRQVERLLKLDPKNTELLAQKQRLLSEAVENTKSKLETLREAERQVQQQFERGEIGEKQYRAIQREVIKTEQEIKKLENQLKETNNKWKETAETLDKFGKKTTEIGKDMTAKVTAPIVGAAAASMVAWKEVDDALDTIVTKTGATGEAMEGLEESFRNVTKTLPVEIQAVGEAIGEVNTQFGFTGEKLEEATTLLLKFAQINGQDVTTATINSKEAIESFGLSADNLNEVLDAVTRTAQNTGVSTDKLFDSVIKGAPQLKALGLDFAQATALMGSFEQKGIDSSKALTYLSRAQVQFAKDGKTLEEGLTELVTKLQNTADETEALNIASEVFGTRGATFMLDAIQRGALDFEDFANAAKLAAGAVTETYEGTLDPVDKFTVAFNNLKLVGSDIAALIQERLAPIIEKLVEKLQGAADWFRNLSPEMQNTILVIGGLVAAIGPLLIIVGKIASGISAIMGLFGGFSAAAGGATAATGGLGSVLTALTGPIGIAVAAIAGLTAGGIALYKHLKEDAIPEVQLFGEETSESTKKAVGGFLELNDKATLALNQLSWSGQEVTQEMATNITNNFSQMAEQVQAGLDSHYQETLQKMQGFINNSTSLSKEEQDEILNNMQEGYENRKQTIEKGEARIKEILTTASNEKRALTKEEQEEINTIQKQMVDTGIQVLSENELEAKAIMERMKQQAGEISARQAAEVVQNSLKQKEETIKAAEEQYNEVIKEIIRQRDEAGTITAEQADKLIQEAKRQRDEVVTKAEEMHNQVVEQAKLQAGEHVNQVDWETGQILSKWDMFKRNVGQKVTKIKENAIETWQNMWNEIKNKVENAWEYMSDAFSSLWDSISNWFENLIDDAFDWGKNLIDGFIDGIKSMINKVKNAVTSVVNTVSDYLGFHSPAKKGEGRYIVDWGQNMIEGFMEGMQKALPQLQLSAKAVVPVIKNEIINTAQIDYSKIPKGDTIIHVYNPQPNPIELGRQIQKTQRNLALGY